MALECIGAKPYASCPLYSTRMGQVAVCVGARAELPVLLCTVCRGSRLVDHAVS